MPPAVRGTAAWLWRHCFPSSLAQPNNTGKSLGPSPGAGPTLGVTPEMTSSELSLLLDSVKILEPAPPTFWRQEGLKEGDLDSSICLSAFTKLSSLSWEKKKKTAVEVQQQHVSHE